MHLSALAGAPEIWLVESLLVGSNHTPFLMVLNSVVTESQALNVETRNRYGMSLHVAQQESISHGILRYPLPYQPHTKTRPDLGLISAWGGGIAGGVSEA